MTPSSLSPVKRKGPTRRTPTRLHLTTSSLSVPNAFIAEKSDKEKTYDILDDNILAVGAKRSIAEFVVVANPLSKHPGDQMAFFHFGRTWSDSFSPPLPPSLTPSLPVSWVRMLNVSFPLIGPMLHMVMGLIHSCSFHHRTIHLHGDWLHAGQKNITLTIDPFGLRGFGP